MKTHSIRAYLRQHGGPKMRGGAVIMAMLTVALVAGISAAILSDFGHAVAHVSGRHDQAQARWLARGAIDWARNVLEEDGRQGGANAVDHFGEQWTIKVPPTAVEEGEVSGELIDQSGRFNLNSLVRDGSGDNGQIQIYIRLLTALKLSPQKALELSDALVDWIDEDVAPSGSAGAEEVWYRAQRRKLPPNAPLLDVTELINVKGYDRETIELLNAHVAALPGNVQQINVNTASAAVLSAHVEVLDLNAARAIVESRTPRFFTSPQSFFDRLPPNAGYNAQQFSVQSHYFLGTGRATWGEAATHIEVLLYRPPAQRPEILWQKIL